MLRSNATFSTLFYSLVYFSFSALALLKFGGQIILYLGPNYRLGWEWGAVLGTVGFLAASLTSIHPVPVTPHPWVVTIKNVTRYCQMSLRGKVAPAWGPWSISTPVPHYSNKYGFIVYFSISLDKLPSSCQNFHV